jgi:uncharacterized phage protein (TIGR02218 family)
MLTLPPILAAHLATGTTTLCTCWRLTRGDGVVLGFTDHDRDLSFDGTTFEAASGFTATEAKASLGNAVDNLEVTGALTSDRLTAAELADGAYDDAKVEIWRVNWADVAQRVLLRTGSLGETGHGSSSFFAEVRGLTHVLGQEQGRTYQYTCDAELGDARCSVALTNPVFRGTGAVAAVSADGTLTVSGLSTFTTGWFTRGVITWTSGARAGRSDRVRRHEVSVGVVTLDVWQRSAVPQSVGDTFTAVAGCNKDFATCREKFANGLNFRGMPHMPGNDFLTRYPNRDDASNDGNSAFSQRT